MPLQIIGNDAPATPPQAVVPNPQPKILPQAANGKDNTWPSANDDAADGEPGDEGIAGLPGSNGLNGGHTPANINVYVSTFQQGVFAAQIRGGTCG
jgi:hypothetical protein